MGNKKYVFLILIIIFILIFFNDFSFKLVKKYTPSSFKVLVKKKFFGEKFDQFDQLNSILYNQHFIPKTHFENLEFEKIKLDFLESNIQGYHKNYIKKFFLEKVNNDLVAFSNNEIYKFKNFDLKKKIKLDSNLDKFNFSDVLDISKIQDDLFISAAFKNNELNCSNLKILNARINEENLKFDIFFSFDECLKNIVGGRIKEYNFNKKNGFLITTGAYFKDEKLISQDNDSLFGKIIFFDLSEKNFMIFSKGHRNPQGLLVEDKIILSTEHADYGGDEINKITLNGNYGYPVSSYGEPYEFRKDFLAQRKNYVFKKNHSKNYFTEPIYSFLPSIGISEIISVPEKFSKYWNDNFLVSSLGAKSLYRIKFSDDYKKIIYNERIFVGERIRDLLTNNEGDKLYLALENTGSIGIISVKKN